MDGDVSIDAVRLAFDASGLMALNIVLAVIMFGVALDLRVSQFVALMKNPRAPLVGLTTQFLVLPAATYGLILLLDVPPSLGLGMLLVASCPGGNVSNFMVNLSKGRTSTSVGMTAISTLAAAVVLPLNLSFWSSQSPEMALLVHDVHLSPLDLLLTIALILALPVLLGMGVAARFPAAAATLRKPMKWLSVLFFVAFVGIAFAKNVDHFLMFIGLVFLPVAIMNAGALALGYFAGASAGLDEPDRRAVSIEVGIQNSGLGLIICFEFFDGLGGMAVVAAWWGIWHIISGMTLAFYWARKTNQASGASGPTIAAAR